MGPLIFFLPPNFGPKFLPQYESLIWLQGPLGKVNVRCSVKASLIIWPGHTLRTYYDLRGNITQLVSQPIGE